MSRKVDSMISDYVEAYVSEVHGSSFSGINTVEKILKDPGHSTEGSQHRVLFWHKSHRIAKVSKAFHILSPKEVMVLVVHYGGVLNDDGSTFTEKQLMKNSSMTTRRLGDIIRNAKKKVGDFVNNPDNYK